MECNKYMASLLITNSIWLSNELPYWAIIPRSFPNSDKILKIINKLSAPGNKGDNSRDNYNEADIVR